MLQAYVLIQTETGKAVDVTMAVAGMPGVSSASAVNGPYDVIAMTEAADVDELGNAIVAKLQTLEGVTRTLTAQSSGYSGAREGDAGDSRCVVDR